MRAFRVWIAGVVGGFLAVAPIAAAGAEAPPPSAAARPAGTVYSEICAYCHGRNVGPIVLGRELAADAIRLTVRQGLNAMPAFRPSEISEPELAALAEFIKTSKSNPAEHGE